MVLSMGLCYGGLGEPIAWIVIDKPPLSLLSEINGICDSLPNLRLRVVEGLRYFVFQVPWDRRHYGKATGEYTSVRLEQIFDIEP